VLVQTRKPCKLLRPTNHSTSSERDASESPAQRVKASAPRSDQSLLEPNLALENELTQGRRAHKSGDADVSERMRLFTLLR
jgi:hypothetical protein